MESRRTDLASEILEPKVRRLNEHIVRTDVTIDKKLSDKFGKPVGNYSTIESDIVVAGDERRYDRLIKALSDALAEYIGGCENCLVVGLGNPDMTADALGSKVSAKIDVTRNIAEADSSGKKRGISTICPNVLGVTGIESFDVVKGVVDRIKPSLVVVVDSLCAASVKRIATAFQICSAGITPGSGVSNFRFRLDEESLGVKVVSIGVPLVVYASTIIDDVVGGKVNKYKGDILIESMIVTPKDIDLIVEDCAGVIASAINYALS